MRQLLRVTSIFALALVFTAGMAFGQSADDVTADVTQKNGNSNTATIDQSAAQDASSVVDQFGSNNDADITQTSTKDSENKTNEVTVKQFGRLNDAIVDQIGGSGTVSVVRQNGNSNKARTFLNPQAPNFDVPLVSTTQIQRGGNNNFARIDAKGAKVVDIEQKQVGSQNFSDLTGVGTRNGSLEISTNQNGFSNYVDAELGGNGATQNSVVARQFGDGNIANVTMTGSTGHTANITQNGSFNETTVDQ